MYRVLPLIAILLLTLPAMFLGKYRDGLIQQEALKHRVIIEDEPVTDRASLEVLNGTNIDGAANELKGFLIKNHYDVKKAGNVIVRKRLIKNYKKTLVISRTRDLTKAIEVAKLIKSAPPIFIRTDYNESDITVIIGHDYGDIRK